VFRAASPRNTRDDADLNQEYGSGSRQDSEPVERDAHEASSKNRNHASA
jgi:hypothetical protein